MSARPRYRAIVALGMFLTLAGPSKAWSQVTVTQTVRGYLVAQAGVSQIATTGALLGVEVGDAMTSNLQAYATFSYLDNIMRKQVRNDLEFLGSLLTLQTGIPREFTGRDLGLALTGGVKYLVPLGSLRPYAGVGGGGIRLKRTITERTIGNVTATVLPVLGDEGFIGTDQASATRPIAEALVGVGVVVGRGYLDAGWRYRKIFHAGAPYEFWQFAVGAGVRF